MLQQFERLIEVDVGVAENKVLMGQMLVDVSNGAIEPQPPLIFVVDNGLHDFVLVRAKRERVNLVVEQMDCLDVWIGDVAHQTIIQLTLALGVIGLIVRCHKMKHVQDGRVINCT